MVSSPFVSYNGKGVDLRSLSFLPSLRVFYWLYGSLVFVILMLSLLYPSVFESL